MPWSPAPFIPQAVAWATTTFGSGRRRSKAANRSWRGYNRLAKNYWLRHSILLSSNRWKEYGQAVETSSAAYFVPCGKKPGGKARASCSLTDMLMIRRAAFTG